MGKIKIPMAGTTPAVMATIVLDREKNHERRRFA
jgi:hypothetical protein